MSSVTKKKVKFKKGIFQKLFWVISGFFLLILLVYFGIRFIISSKIYGNSYIKAHEYIINNLKKEDGLYQEGNEYVFKGNIESNYLQYNNLLFRIVKIYKDGSIELIMDQGINALYYNDKYTSYLESDIHKYLNEYFLPILDKDDLNKSPICKDMVNDIEKITCDQVDYSSYVKLLMVGDFVNSILEGETYISDDRDYYWLGNVSEDKVWNTDGSKLSQSDVDKGYKIKPVITLNENVKYLSGNGSKEEPIVVKERDIGVNSYVKIDDDLYVVIDTEKSYLKMMLMEENPLVVDVFDNKLLDKLNDKYYNSLNYKDILVKYTIDVGKYMDSYHNVRDKKESVYVGIPTVNDFKFDNSDINYLLINVKDNDNGYYYNNGLYLNDISLARKIRPVIMIKKQEISSGKGLVDDPYVVEVQ